MSLVLQKPSPWRCTSCSGYFTTIDYLRDHIKIYHPNRKHFCRRCPFSCDSERKKYEHEKAEVCNVVQYDVDYIHGPFYLTAWVHGISDKLHAKKDNSYKNTSNGEECRLCNVWFRTGIHETQDWWQRFGKFNVRTSWTVRVSLVQSKKWRSFTTPYKLSLLIQVGSQSDASPGKLYWLDLIGSSSELVVENPCKPPWALLKLIFD